MGFSSIGAVVIGIGADVEVKGYPNELFWLEGCY